MRGEGWYGGGCRGLEGTVERNFNMIDILHNVFIWVLYILTEMLPSATLRSSFKTNRRTDSKTNRQTYSHSNIDELAVSKPVHLSSVCNAKTRKSIYFYK